MFDETTIPVQLRDYREWLLARDAFQCELHGQFLEEDLGQVCRRARKAGVEPRASIRGQEKFDLAYPLILKANGLWRVGRWDEAAAAISEALKIFEDPFPEAKGE